uniref:Phosphatidylinositol N-acetylglucosaminyltransferase subunit H conserved domain-containing protein n=1 Tax=Trichobilharzia regenti TaxID=157069 RepID=A0AA85JQY0_TRIRE|nr:unnamed protein product [Trichobilharzia regenti]
MKYQSTPAWIEVKLYHNVSILLRLFFTLVCMLFCCIIGYITQSYLIQFILFFSFVISIYTHLRNTVIEESLLVISGYGLQTSSYYFTGRRLYSSFIPADRIKAIHLIDSVSPFSIHTYLGCEFINNNNTNTNNNDNNNDNKVNTLLTDYSISPLMPIVMNSGEIRFNTCNYIPLPYLVWMLRLVNFTLFH